MPFECSKFFEKSYNFYFTSIGMNKIFKSPFNISILLTLIILFIIIIYFPSKPNTPIYIIFKIGFYIFLSSYLAIFLHGCIIKNINKKKNNDDEIYSYSGGNSFNCINSNSIKPNLGGREIIGGDSYDTYDNKDEKNIDKILNDKTYPEDSDNELTDDKENIFASYGV